MKVISIEYDGLRTIGCKPALGQVWTSIFSSVFVDRPLTNRQADKWIVDLIDSDSIFQRL